jgi:hypothetical protein
VISWFSQSLLFHVQLLYRYSAAKASLTQMLTVVFHRLEADSAEAPAPTIVVADLLRPGAHTKDDDTVVGLYKFNPVYP